MKQYHIYLLILITIFSCKSQDVVIINKVAEEIGCTGSIGFYRTMHKKPSSNDTARYIDLELDCPNISDLSDPFSYQISGAYRLYSNLNDFDKKNNDGIAVLIKNPIHPIYDSLVFFPMTDLNEIYISECYVRDFFLDLEKKDDEAIKSNFDHTVFDYSDFEIDSIIRSFSYFSNGKLNESRLYNWDYAEKNDERFKLLIFLTDSKNNYNKKFQIALHDSLRNDGNIVKISFN